MSYISATTKYRHVSYVHRPIQVSSDVSEKLNCVCNSGVLSNTAVADDAE